MSENENKKRTKKIIITVVCAVLAAAVICGIIYFSWYNSEEQKTERYIENLKGEAEILQDMYNRQNDRINQLERDWDTYQYYSSKLN